MTGPTITNIQNSESLEMIETEGNTQKGLAGHLWLEAGHCCHCNIVAQNTTITPLTSLVFRIITSTGHQLNCKDDFRL